MAPVHNIHFKLQNGQIYGILGDEHSGGSTLLSLLSGSIPPLSGEVLLGGFDTVRDPLQARRLVGYFPASHHPAPDLTPVEYLMLAAEMRGMEYNRALRRTEELLDWTALTDKRSTLIRRLSAPEVRLLGLAQTLFGDPEFILLEEITRDLPVKEAQGIREWICELRSDHTIFLCSQNETELRTLCDRILLLHSGELVGIFDRNEELPSLPTREPTVSPAHAAPPKKPSRWSLLTQNSTECEVIDFDEKEDRR